MTHTETALGLFAQQMHCSQSVLAAFAEELGITKEEAFRLGGAFGGGMRKGEVCGACTGALMAIGLRYGQTAVGDTEAKQCCDQKTVAFLNAFQAENGSFLCRELLGYNLSSETQRDAARAAGVFGKVCPRMIRSAVEILETLL